LERFDPEFGSRRLESKSAYAGQSPSVASLAYDEASSDSVGQTKTIKKKRSGEVRCAHERREKKPVRLAVKLTPVHAFLISA